MCSDILGCHNSVRGATDIWWVLLKTPTPSAQAETPALAGPVTLHCQLPPAGGAAGAR